MDYVLLQKYQIEIFYFYKTDTVQSRLSGLDKNRPCPDQ